ncbi:hypothetical protein CEXT_642761 [Caerostris extrusa]|uniref:Uncharacterized protein n=1 Tax=Caerostris extrusa TaxID=172846 RepID=A0AAV4RBH6_CAEEX|nr:hypothetical protein CEXT_642761 [Caerostris extrusa]
MIGKQRFVVGDRSVKLPAGRNLEEKCFRAFNKFSRLEQALRTEITRIDYPLYSNYHRNGVQDTILSMLFPIRTCSEASEKTTKIGFDV